VLSKKTYENKLMLYIPVDKRQTVKQLREILKREGKTLSKFFLEYAQRYCEQHRSGNPQLLMSHYVKPGEPQPLRVLCLYIGGALTNGDVYCRKVGMWIKSIRCYSCKYNQLRKNR